MVTPVGEWRKYRKNVNPWVKQPNDNSTGKTKIVRGVFCLSLHPQRAWEDEGWRTGREQQAGDDLEEVELARPTSGQGYYKP